MLNDSGVRIRELPALSSVSKEAISTALGILQKKGDVSTKTAGRAKLVQLTSLGLQSQAIHCALIDRIEQRWTTLFGIDKIRDRLRGFDLRQGLEPYPDGWRASVPRLQLLPHFPMVLHRGGFPDGS